MVQKQAAIWVSTVLYILISLAIIGIVIAAVTPRINAAKDRATIEQSIIMLDSIDSTIQKVNQVQGTKLKAEFKMSRGLLTINPLTDTIKWQLNNSAYKYSEPDVTINISAIQLKTTKASQGSWNVELMLNYSNKIDIQFGVKTLQPAEVPYKLWIENVGISNGLNQINITVS